MNGVNGGFDMPGSGGPGSAAGYPASSSQSSHQHDPLLVPRSHADTMSVGGDEAKQAQEEAALYKEAVAFKGAAVVELVETEDKHGDVERALEITMEDGVTLTVELDSGEKRLIELGYTQELKRTLNAFQLFSAAICTMSIWTLLLPMIPFSYLCGGSVGVVWYWWITCFFVHMVALSFAEIASSFPTAGSLYFWAAALAGPKYAPAVSFFTGWAEFMGLAVGFSSIAYWGVQNTLTQLIFMSSGVLLNHYMEFALAIGVNIICLSLNLFPMRWVANFFVFGTVWQVAGVLVTVVLVPLVAVTHQPASWVFGFFYEFTELTNMPSSAYSFLVALNTSQVAMMGYDGVAHLSEEAKRSDRTAPMAIVASVTTFSILGWLLLVSLMFSVQNTDALLLVTPNAPNSAYWQIMYDVFYGRYGSALGAEILIIVFFGSIIFRCVATMLGSSRVCFALSRDKGLPFSDYWKRVNAKTGVPVNSVVLTLVIGLVLMLPILGVPEMLPGFVAISGLAWTMAYATPVWFRLIQKEEDFCPGPFYMPDYIGVWGGKCVHGLAMVWISYSIVNWCMPYQFPITPQNFIWSSVAMFIILFILAIWWVLDARKWFQGPLRFHQMQEEENAMGVPGSVEVFESQSDRVEVFDSRRQAQPNAQVEIFDS